MVGETVQSFALWFVFHWILYGVTTIMALVVITMRFGNEESIVKRTYVFLFFLVHLFMFVFPCGCAAYITSTCSGEYLFIGVLTISSGHRGCDTHWEIVSCKSRGFDHAEVFLSAN